MIYKIIDDIVVDGNIVHPHLFPRQLINRLVFFGKCIHIPNPLSDAVMHFISYIVVYA